MSLSTVCRSEFSLANPKRQPPLKTCMRRLHSVERLRHKVYNQICFEFSPSKRPHATPCGVFLGFWGQKLPSSGVFTWQIGLYALYNKREQLLYQERSGRTGDGAGAGLGRVAAAAHHGKNGKNSWRNFLTTASSSWLMMSSESQSQYIRPQTRLLAMGKTINLFTCGSRSV